MAYSWYPFGATSGKYSGNLTQSLSGTVRTVGRGFDVVHFHAMGPCLFTPLARLAATAAVVATIQGRDDQRAKWGPAARASLRTAAWVSAHVPHEVIVVSKQLGHHYEDDYAVPPTTSRTGSPCSPSSRQADTAVLDRFGSAPGLHPERRAPRPGKGHGPGDHRIPELSTPTPSS